MDYDEVGLNLTDRNSKYGAQRVKWLLESKNLPQDTIEHFLANKSLGYYKMKVPVDQIKNITNFYDDSLITWYCINPIYNYKTIQISKKLLFPFLPTKRATPLNR